MSGEFGSDKNVRGGRRWTPSVSCFLAVWMQLHIYTGPSDASLSSICTTPHHLFSLCFPRSIPGGRWNLQVYFYRDDTLHLLSPLQRRIKKYICVGQWVDHGVLVDLSHSVKSLAVPLHNAWSSAVTFLFHTSFTIILPTCWLMTIIFHWSRCQPHHILSSG